MKKYSVYRAVFLNQIEDLDLENIGQSFAMDLSGAERYSDDKSNVDSKEVFIIEAIITQVQINWEQTVAQQLSQDWNHEGEVVLLPYQTIKFEVKDIYNKFIMEGEGNTGYDRMDGDESKAYPFNEDHDDWSPEVFENAKAEILSCLY